MASLRDGAVLRGGGGASLARGWAAAGAVAGPACGTGSVGVWRPSAGAVSGRGGEDASDPRREMPRVCRMAARSSCGQCVIAMTSSTACGLEA